MQWLNFSENWDYSRVTFYFNRKKSGSLNHLKDFEKDSLQQGLCHFQLIYPTPSSDDSCSIIMNHYL